MTLGKKVSPPPFLVVIFKMVTSWSQDFLSNQHIFLQGEVFQVFAIIFPKATSYDTIFLLSTNALMSASFLKVLIFPFSIGTYNIISDVCIK